MNDGMEVMRGEGGGKRLGFVRSREKHEASGGTRQDPKHG
uniref:Uncharacterized protein n=1 Tax=Lotus japonicus TaxID=34305 RepID=I3SM44_LOTJA|nr:unknown [Lotus japonicus]